MISSSKGRFSTAKLSNVQNPSQDFTPFYDVTDQAFEIHGAPADVPAGIESFVSYAVRLLLL